MVVKHYTDLIYKLIYLRNHRSIMSASSSPTIKAEGFVESISFFYTVIIREDRICLSCFYFTEL